MSEYPGNSDKSKKESTTKEVVREKKQSVIQGTASTKKKGLLSRFSETFTLGHTNDVKNYILVDILIPSVKKALYDMVVNGTDMILFRGQGGGRRGQKSNISRASYADYHTGTRYGSQVAPVPVQRTGFEYDEIIFETIVDAEQVLRSMDAVLEQYDSVSVADLYEFAGLTNPNWNVHKYGWTNIAGSYALPVRDGYILKLPPVVSIK